ncbi:MAG: DUF1330 domain-containing protein [Rhodocyclales bacterium]|nr:DUF1330 domain-containing protein [Rhodocyclales bacterium]
MGKAWLIGHITVRDATKWEEYRGKVPATMAPYGAELSFRGKLARVLSGSHGHGDVVVASFPDRAALEAWHASPAYQALIPLRTAAAEVDLMSYDT